MCNFWSFYQWPSCILSAYMAIMKIDQYLINHYLNQNSTIYVQLLELLPMVKFHAQIWQVWKSTCTSETFVCRVKISSISTPWGRKKCMCNFWNFAVVQVPCPNMAILKIDQYLRNQYLLSENKLNFGHNMGRNTEYRYNFWIFCQGPSFMRKYHNYENCPVSRKLLPIEQK